jgi:hypothetical protein
MLFIKLTCPEDKKSKSAKKREVYISADKIRFMQKNAVARGNAQTEIWFDSKDSITVTETPEEIVSLIEQKLSGKTENKIIAFKQDFDSKEYEDFINREG